MGLGLRKSVMWVRLQAVQHSLVGAALRPMFNRQ